MRRMFKTRATFLVARDSFADDTAAQFLASTPARPSKLGHLRPEEPSAECGEYRRMRKPYLLTTSDEHVSDCLAASHAYYTEHTEFAEVLDDIFLALRAVEDLIPQDGDRFWSGHFFPTSECVSQAEISFQLAMRGFYREAFVSARSFLDLGLLSVFWDKDDRSHLAIQEWLRSREDTPFFKNQLLRAIMSIPAFAQFQQRIDLHGWAKDQYDFLSDYVHIKGIAYSNRGMWQANFPRFSQGSLEKWSSAFAEVARLVLVAHTLRYPLALQFTPIDEKFGLNSPVGSFLRPEQIAQIRSFLPNHMIDILQEISDSDAAAVSIAQQIVALPDITEEQFRLQAEHQDKWYIEMNGFQEWARSLGSPHSGGDAETIERRGIYAARLERWSRETGNYDPRSDRPVQTNNGATT